MKLDHYVLTSAAYRSLNSVARAIYTELRRRYNGLNNGAITASIRELKIELHCGSDAARAGLKDLQERGFIKVARHGGFHYKVAHATTWTLIEEKIGDESPSKECMRWKPHTEKPGPE